MVLFRDATLEDLGARRDRMSAVGFAPCRHIINESGRVVGAKPALLQADIRSTEACSPPPLDAMLPVERGEEDPAWPCIVGMGGMHPKHEQSQFRNIDLNLLTPLKALLHKRNVTRAAERIHLSQSAMSRALDRLRSGLGDELLVRVGRNYELTPRGSELLDELAQVMPRLARLRAGETFSPRKAKDTSA
jgi:DNA-binding MarR family transcriptional regulator